MSQTNEYSTAALQTPPGKGGIAVISLVGPDVASALRDLFQPRNPKNELSEDDGRLHLGSLIDGEEILDEAVVALTPRGAEINIHGGPVTARRVLRKLTALGFRAAAAEEAPFAPAHPRWNNPAVGRELQSALPHAPCLLSASVLTNQWSGGISQLAREFLTAPSVPPDATDRLLAAADALRTTRRLREPPEVVLAGPPNSGKSTLMNALVGRPVSIVHDQAGTTRDWVRQRAILTGRCVYLTDTAGLWETDHLVDAESVRRAWNKIASADLVLLLSAGDPVELPRHVQAKQILHVRTKRDEGTNTNDPRVLSISAHAERGMDELTAAILDALGLANIDASTATAFTPRQELLLRTAAGAIAQNDREALRMALQTLLGNE